MKIIRMADYWSHITPAAWLAAMTPPSKGLRGQRFEMLLNQLAQHFPQPGLPTHQEMPVILKPGKDIGAHAHPEYTIVYFIDAEETPLIMGGQEIWPANNTAILIGPGVVHAVAKNITDRPRLSLAMRWEWHHGDS